MRKTKIICTIGPASERKEVLKKMFNVVEISAKDQARWF